MRIFNLFMIPLRKIRNRHQQSTRMKVHKKTWHTVFGLDVAGRLVDNAFYVKLTEDLVPQMFFYYYRKHPDRSLHLFVIDFTILDRLRTFRIFFNTRFILYSFCHIVIHNYEIKRNCGEKEMSLSYYLPWCLTSI